tara:strand:- start:439 stop:981 length:543 start_codon:yes stop_codon:yes gene_type:complete
MSSFNVYPINLILSSPAYLEIANKQIANNVRVSQTDYIMNKASINVVNNILTEKKLIGSQDYEWTSKPTNAGDRKLRQWNQSSDRAYPSLYKLKKQNIPSRGNSTKTSLIRHRPGASGSSGKGVDLKHNSYHRYLLKKKGLKHLRGEINNNTHPYLHKGSVNNKWKKDTIIANAIICSNC